MTIFKIIMIACILIVFITLFMSLRSANKPKKNMFMAVTLPYDVLESDFIKQIQKEYKSLCNKVYLLMLVTAIPIIFPFWILNNITVYIFYTMIWSLGFAYYGITPFKLMNRKVKAEKAKNNWFVGEKKVVYCDTKTTLLKNSMPISNKYFLIPILIGIIPLIISIKNFSSENIVFLIIAILNLGVIVLLFYFAKLFNKNKLKTYSTDSEINFILNKQEKRLFSIYFLINAIVESLTFLIFYSMFFEYIDLKFSNTMVISILILSSAVAIGIIYIKKKFDILAMEKGDWKLERHLAGKLTGVGIPMGLQYSITGIGSVILQTAVNGLGSIYVASMTAGSKINIFLACPFDALGQTMAPYAGQNIGARKLDRVGKGLRAACIIGFIVSGLMVIVVKLFGDQLTMLFLDEKDPVIMQNSTQFLIIVSAFYCLLTLVNTVRFTIQGMGFSSLAIIAGVMEMIARGIAGMLLVPAFGYLGACYSSPLAWLLADAFLIPAFFLCKRKVARQLEVGKA